MIYQMHPKEQRRWEALASRWQRMADKLASAGKVALNEEIAATETPAAELVVAASLAGVKEIQERAADVPVEARPVRVFEIDPRKVTAGKFFSDMCWMRRSVDAGGAAAPIEREGAGEFPEEPMDTSARAFFHVKVPWAARPVSTNAGRASGSTMDRKSFSALALSTAVDASHGRRFSPETDPLPKRVFGQQEPLSAGSFFSNVNWNKPPSQN